MLSEIVIIFPSYMVGNLLIFKSLIMLYILIHSSCSYENRKVKKNTAKVKVVRKHQLKKKDYCTRSDGSETAQVTKKRKKDCS